jgi:hypothetical protein
VKYGDTLEGCRFLGESPLKIGNDVWFVGHCIVSPIVAEDKSMALVGSVITQNMLTNQIYAGSPAKSISEKIGNQFDNVSIDDKFDKMQHFLKEWKGDVTKIKIVKYMSDIKDYIGDLSIFCIESRTYTKRLTESEIDFMKFLLPAKAKFTPHIVQNQNDLL